MRSKPIDPGNPPLTTAELRGMRPARDVLPAKFLEAHRLRREAAEAADDPPLPRNKGRTKANTPKTAVSIRLDDDVIEKLRKSGADWHTRANDMLRKALRLKPVP